MHAVELVAIILDHIIVFPFLVARRLTAPGARTGTGTGARTGTETGLILRLGFVLLSGALLAGRQTLVGAFCVDHFVGFT